MNISLNFGGLIGAIGCGVIVGVIAFSSLDVDNWPAQLTIFGVVAGAFAGNVLWSRVFPKSK